MAPETSPLPKPRPPFLFEPRETPTDGIESVFEAIRQALPGAGVHSNLAIVIGAAILAAGLIAGGVVVLRKWKKSKCRWKKAPAKTQTTATRWVCKTCGIDAFSHDGRPPKECKRALRPRPL